MSAEVDSTSSSLLWRIALGLPALAFVMLFLLEAGGNMTGAWLGVNPWVPIALGGLVGTLAGLLHPSMSSGEFRVWWLLVPMTGAALIIVRMVPIEFGLPTCAVLVVVFAAYYASSSTWILVTQWDELD